jgi:hypothetical protein
MVKRWTQQRLPGWHIKKMGMGRFRILEQTDCAGRVSEAFIQAGAAALCVRLNCCTAGKINGATTADSFSIS